MAYLLTKVCVTARACVGGYEYHHEYQYHATFKSSYKMAFNVLSQPQTQQNTGGYECKFLEEPSNDLKCLICLCVARDPLQHGGEGCGKIFCRVCITEYQKRSKTCPNCRREIVTFRDVRSEY